MKTLGILGGMGPHAGLRFCEMLLQDSIDRFGAVRNEDYPHFLLSNIPVPDLISSRDDEEKTVSMVEEEAKRLEKAGAQIIVLACNTMHLFQDRFRKATKAQFVSLVDAVVQNVVRDGRKKVGLLGSMTTMKSGLYSEPLGRSGIEVLLPSPADQQEISRVVETIVAHRAVNSEKIFLQKTIESLRAQGADSVILGCTELPQIFTTGSAILPVYDSLRILAETACEEMYAPSSL
jgi:aspartate racemase